VYTQGIGLAQVLFQCGLFVPGTRASISPADRIVTHFQIEGNIGNDCGRFADEAKCMEELIDAVSEKSPLLTNESFSSTSYTESLYIAFDIMKITKTIGLRVVFATHFHALATRVDAINEQGEGGSKLTSMVSKVETAHDDPTTIVRMFKIVTGPTTGKSCAREIA
jgi:DNA mismatch repair protein MutS